MTKTASTPSPLALISEKTGTAPDDSGLCGLKGAV